MTLEQAIELLKYRYIKFIDGSFEGVKEQREAVAILIEHAEQSLRLGGKLPDKIAIDCHNEKSLSYDPKLQDAYCEGYNQALDDVQKVLHAIVADEVKKKMLTLQEIIDSMDCLGVWDGLGTKLTSNEITNIAQAILAKMRGV